MCVVIGAGIYRWMLAHACMSVQMGLCEAQKYNTVVSTLKDGRDVHKNTHLTAKTTSFWKILVNHIVTLQLLLCVFIRTFGVERTLQFQNI